MPRGIGTGEGERERSEEGLELCDVYYYGDGSTYPDPLHKISWEGSYFTNSHRMRFYLAYDSKYLIPNMRVNASVTYVDDPLYTFWGFNGPASVQDYALWSNRDLVTLLPGADGKTRNVNYYGMSRDMLRVLANFQGQIVPHLNWAAGINFWWWRMGSMRDKPCTTSMWNWVLLRRTRKTAAWPWS